MYVWDYDRGQRNVDAKYLYKVDKQFYKENKSFHALDDGSKIHQSVTLKIFFKLGFYEEINSKSKTT